MNTFYGRLAIGILIGAISLCVGTMISSINSRINELEKEVDQLKTDLILIANPEPEIIYLEEITNDNQ